MSHKIDYFSVQDLISKTERGISINSTDGDIEKVVIKGGIVESLNYRALECVTTPNGKIGMVSLYSMNLASPATSEVIYLRGNFWYDGVNTDGELGVKLNMIDCKIDGGTSRVIRANDAQVKSVLQSTGDAFGTPTTNVYLIEGDAVITIDGVDQ